MEGVEIKQNSSEFLSWGDEVRVQGKQSRWSLQGENQKERFAWKAREKRKARKKADWKSSESSSLQWNYLKPRESEGRALNDPHRTKILCLLPPVRLKATLFRKHWVEYAEEYCIRCGEQLSLDYKMLWVRLTEIILARLRSFKTASK